MHSNPFRLLVLAWFSFWLVVFIPGHTRGAVEVPGQASESTRGSCCTPAPVPSCCAPSASELPADLACCDLDALQDGSGDDLPDDPARRCMICFLKAHLTDAPPVVLYTPFLGELDEIAYEVESSVYDDLAVLDRVRGRGPPC